MSDIVRQRAIELNDFSGGLNNYWDPSSIADNEVSFLQNMEFTPNGALTSRPPIVDRNIGNPYGYGANVKMNILGYYTPENGKIFLVATTPAVPDLAAGPKTWVMELTQYGFGNWIEIWNAEAVDFVQYANQIIMCRPASGGARWKDGDATFTAITQMPALSSLALFRERMFGTGVQGTAGETAIYWSDINTLDQPNGIYEWNADSFVYVGRGDGQPITYLVADYNGLIIFKRNSTYNLVYGELPEEGTISLVQVNIGAQNRRAVVGYQNGFIVLHNRTLYKFQNNVYAPINSQKIRFEYKTDFPSGALFDEAVSVFGDRGLVFTQGNLYAINLLTGSWSQWETSTALAYVLEAPKPRTFQWPYTFALGIAVATPNIASGGFDLGQGKLLFIQDYPSSSWLELVEGQVVEAGGDEGMICIMKTKIYDFDTPSEWKRLYWWSADVATNGGVVGRFVPVGIPELAQTWDQLDQFTWDYLGGLTWDTLFERDASVESNRGVENPGRFAVKMDKSARFRRGSFELYLVHTGAKDSIPAQIFSLTPMIGVKAKMSKDVA